MTSTGETEEVFDMERAQESGLFSISPCGIEAALAGALHAEEDGFHDQHVAHTHDDDCDLGVGYDDEATETNKARKGVEFLERQLEKCTCEPRCCVPNIKHHAQTFALMSERERTNVVRGMLFALAADRGQENELRAIQTAPRKRARLRDEGTRYTTAVYCVRGKVVCRDVFAGAVQVSPRTVSKYSTMLAEAGTMQIMETAHRGRKRGTRSVQSLICIAFFERYGELNGMPCPTGRGSGDEKAVRSLPSSTTMSDVYMEYKSMWGVISPCVAGDGARCPSEPLLQDSFVRLWRQSMPTLRVFKKGSDFCDTCTYFRNYIHTCDEPETRNCAMETLQRHRENAVNEFRGYKEMMARALNSVSELHLVFDFAEKVLLPHLLRQPGQLHFVTGLKFDIFAVHCSNVARTSVFGLPEGHWPNSKTANEVASMLYHTIKLVRMHDLGDCRRLSLHADNCAGQNKNRFMLWFCALLVILGEFDSVDLRFLVAGHTKNRCDAAFGLIKRKLLQRNVEYPAEMMQTIDASSMSTDAVNATEVRFMQWKDILGVLFQYPKGFQITKYHCFNFSADFLGKVSTRAFSSCSDETEFKLLKPSVTVEQVRAEALSMMSGEKYVTTIVPLDLVPSAKEHNRRGYLLKEVCERYYANDSSFTTKYFASGTNHGTPTPVQ